MSTDRQIMIEQSLKEEAATRLRNDSYKAARRNAWSESRTGQHYTRGFTGKLRHQLQMQLLSQRSVGRELIGLQLLKDIRLDAATIAFLTIKSLVNNLPMVYKNKEGVKRVSMAIRIAKLIEEELRIRHFADDKVRRNLLKKLFRTFHKRQYPRETRKRTIKNYFHAERIAWSVWSDEERLHIGMYLLLLVRDTTGAIELTRESPFVYPAEPLLAEITELLTKGNLVMILHRPMVTPPTPWSPDNLLSNGGGYLNG